MRAVIVASERGEVGLADAMAVLRAGGSAMDAVERAVRAAESNLDDHYVGVGGIPNLLGEVELDASIMDGRTRRVGAVAAVRGYPHPISIARAVLERLPQHVMLVGGGAERFAAEIGAERGETLTEEARRLWRDGVSADGDGDDQSEGDRRYRESAVALLRRLRPHDGPWGTVNVIALDRRGDLCVGVSTSGYPWKYPGRVGDSPLIGAGNYCDNRWAGAACTGRGELAIRAGTAREAARLVGEGLAPDAAALAALDDTVDMPDEFRSPLSVLVLAPDGRHAGASTRPGATYSVMEEDDAAPRILTRAALPASAPEPEPR